MPIFNQSGFGQNEFGFKYVTPGTLRLAGLSAIACILFAVHTHAVPLASTGSSATALSVRRIRAHSLTSAGSSSMAAGVLKMWQATGGPYGQGEFGSRYLMAGTLFTRGSSSLVCSVTTTSTRSLPEGQYGQGEYGSRYIAPGTLFLRGDSSLRCVHAGTHRITLSAAGQSAITLCSASILHRPVTSAGSSLMVVRPFAIKQRARSLSSAGSSAATLGWVRRKIPVPHLATAGSSSCTLFCHRRRIYGLQAHGTSLAASMAATACRYRNMISSSNISCRDQKSVV